MRPLSVLYRGPLSSCNYGCAYCPFAKHHETDEEHALDAAALERFVGWSLERSQAELSVFFTPWGEALTQRRYQRAMVQLSRASHVRRVAVQTNLSAGLDWLGDADAAKVGIWATYHPAWTTLERFVEHCTQLQRWGVHFSVGAVGLPEHVEKIAALRAALPASVYVWINAVKRLATAYSHEELAHFEAVDPLFGVNLHAHPSLGKPCHAGSSVISVDGEGVARRCHFIASPIGNIYDPLFATALEPQPCTNLTCGCHIGYVHLDHLKLQQVFGAGLLERVPQPVLAKP